MNNEPSPIPARRLDQEGTPEGTSSLLCLKTGSSVSRRRWTAVSSTALVAFVIAGASAGVVGPVFEPMMKELAWSNGKTSALATTYTLGYLLSTPAVGYAVDRAGAKAVMAFGAVTAALGLLLASRSYSWYSMMAAFALAGLGFNAAFYMPSAVIVTSWMRSQRSFGMGIVMGAMSAGATLFSSLMGVWLEAYPWRGVYDAIAVLIALMLPIIGWAVRVNTAGGKSDTQELAVRIDRHALLADLLSAPVIVTLSSGALFGFGMQAVYFHIVPLLVHAGYSEHVASLAYAGTWLLSGLGSLMLGLIADRAGAKATLAGALFCCAAGTLFLLGAGVSTLGAACVVAFVLLWGGSVNSFGQLAPVIFAEHRGSTHLGSLMGAQLATAGLSGAAAPLVTGLTYDAFGGYQLAIGTSAAAVLLAFGLILLLKRPQSYDHEGAPRKGASSEHPSD